MSDVSSNTLGWQSTRPYTGNVIGEDEKTIGEDEKTIGEAGKITGISTNIKLKTVGRRPVYNIGYAAVIIPTMISTPSHQQSWRHHPPMEKHCTMSDITRNRRHLEISLCITDQQIARNN